MASPAMVLDLQPWKLTLPSGPKESPTEIASATLKSGYTSVPYFCVTSGPTGQTGVQFRAPVNGVSTSGSNNPRSELREMELDGKTKAAWSSGKGFHRLAVDMAFTRLPTGKPGVGLVGAQIHDSDDDVTVFRLEGSKLWVTKGDATHHALVTDSYQLGTRCVLEFQVWQNEIRALFNGRTVTTLTGKFSGCFFKAGAYSQINAGASPMSASNYGETLIYGLLVEHADQPTNTPVPVPKPVPAPPTTPQPTPPSLTCPHCRKPVTVTLSA